DLGCFLAGRVECREPDLADQRLVERHSAGLVEIEVGSDDCPVLAGVLAIEAVPHPVEERLGHARPAGDGDLFVFHARDVLMDDVIGPQLLVDDVGESMTALDGLDPAGESAAELDAVPACDITTDPGHGTPLPLFSDYHARPRRLSSGQ